MSSYLRTTKHPNGEWQVAQWRDDYFGHHEYGVIFEDGTELRPDYTKDYPLTSDTERPTNPEWGWPEYKPQTTMAGHTSRGPDFIHHTATTTCPCNLVKESIHPQDTIGTTDGLTPWIQRINAAVGYTGTNDHEGVRSILKEFANETINLVTAALNEIRGEL